MSSNIRVERICQFCGDSFVAKTTVTKYCSDDCAKKAYKARKKDEKIKESLKDTRNIKIESLEDLKAKEFLTVTQASKLLNCSRQNVYKLINSGKLKASNLLLKKTIIRRSDIDKLVEETKTKPIIKTDTLEFSVNEFYSLTEVQEQYNVSESALNEIIKRNNIPKFKSGRYAFVPKQIMDQLLK